MGFYHPSTLIADAARHGVEVRPIDVTCSGWRCDVEDAGRAVRLGLRYASGLREAVGTRIETTRAERPFASLPDFQARVAADRAELATLAEIGALAGLGGSRRQAIWQVQALGRSGPLFMKARGGTTSSPLPEMTGPEKMTADFHGTGLSTGPHPMSFVRAELDRQGITRASDLAKVPDGRRARVAGVVIVRQRPGSAKGFVFVTVEDETGFANAIITPRYFEANRRNLLGVTTLVIEGVVQNRDGIASLKADRFRPLPGRPTIVDVARDFH